MPTKVGIITSTAFTGTEFENNFNTGWGGGGPGAANEVPLEMNGVYDADNVVHRKLFQGVATLNKSVANGGSDIIVAFGGLVTAHAVVKRSKRPFIVMIGHLPDSSDFALSDNENYYGGIDLYSASGNIERRDALAAQFTLNPTQQVALLYNPNSRSSKSELAEWTAHGGQMAVSGVAGNNDANDFSNAFAKLHRLGAGGVVITGDPFFSINKIQIINAANNAFTADGLKICYPFNFYNTRASAGDPLPTRGSGMIVGRDLLGAYRAMGVKAAALSASLANPTFQGFDVAQAVSQPL